MTKGQLAALRAHTAEALENIPWLLTDSTGALFDLVPGGGRTPKRLSPQDLMGQVAKAREAVVSMAAVLQDANVRGAGKP